jgi:hypothetical protein
MKKILILIITLISITNISNASFWSISSLDLYKNIDEWINNLQDNMTNFELEWWQEKKWILSEINKLAKQHQTPECLDESKKITPDEFQKITDESQTTEIIKLFNENCQKDMNTTIELAYKYNDLFKLHSELSKNNAKSKTEQIYKISQIWIYSDWDENNSWFDLITDIEEIDKIIFADVIDYEWEQVDNIDNALNDFFEPLNDKINDLIAPKPFNTKEDNSDKPIDYKPQKNINKINDIKETSNSYICIDDYNNSWLSKKALNWLLNNIQNNISSDKDINNDNVNSTINSKNTKDNKDTNFQNPNWTYEKVTNNSIWPCESFFCITIDFTTYEHSLFWWWENITIEYLLNRSNKHLSKAVSTSLVPAKMWTNEFELWLKDLNLPDVFHMSVQVSTKPIPILNIEKKWKQDKTELSANSLLEKYYKIHWLDYKKRNNLDAIKKTETDKQNINNVSWLTIKEALIKQEEINQIDQNKIKQNNTIIKAIDKKVSYWITSTFEQQFTELDKFTYSINNYVLNLHSLINQLRKVPIEY